MIKISFFSPSCDGFNNFASSGKARSNKENIKIVRPSYGLDPKFYFKILGKKVKRDFKSGDRVNLKYLKNN